MAVAAKLTITLLSLFSLVIVVTCLSSKSPTQILRHVSHLPLRSISRLVQYEAAPNIKILDNHNKLAIEEQLAKARYNIRKAVVEKSSSSSEDNVSFISERTVYNNPFAFRQSYKEMKKTFKIWTYKEGDAPWTHDGPMKCIYSIEGDFIAEMERKGNPIAANHPDEAHAFFIPISIVNIVHYLCTPEEKPRFIPHMQMIVEDYIHVIANKYPYWNRSKGADHFYVACHDYGPFVSWRKTELYENVIRVLCNANTSEGFIPRRDVSMPEINAPYNNIPGVSSGQSPYNRSILAFFAGGNHGVVRNRLFEYWGNKQDSDIQVHSYLPKDQNYTELLSQSKYCLCPSGLEVASARATEAIYVGCIPVIIKSHYALPYGDVLDWSQFSVQVPLDKIPGLKKILQEIPFSKYLELQKGVMEVQKHFMVNIPAKQFDVVHMILHSVWLRRLNVKLNPFSLS